MKEKVNVAELLKDCPKGMELDCTIYNGKVYFEGFDHNNSAYPIKISINLVNIERLDIYGQYNTRDYAKCVIFPKGKTTWEGFVPPCKFKDGDVIFYSNTIAIFKEWGDETLFRTYCVLYTTVSNPIYQFEINRPLFGKGIRKGVRLATEEEKQKLFDAIKANGYKWNAETMILEKLIVPKFKAGDKIRLKNKPNGIICIVTKTNKDGSLNVNDYSWVVKYELQDNYELVPNKFDISTLKPFDKVLIRSENSDIWECDIFSSYNSECSNPYHCIGAWYEQCVPYEGNEHLLGTTNDCDEFYKTWKS